MKQWFLLLLFLGFSAIALAQNDQPRVKELGVSFSNLENFGLVYRTGTERALWRFQASSLFASFSSNSSGFNGFFRVGREFRKPLTDKFTFRYGLDLSLGGGYSMLKSPSEEHMLWNINPGVNGVIGVNYAIGKGFVIGAELLPSLSYRYNQTITRSSFLPNDRIMTDQSVNVGITNSGVLLSLIYQF